MPPIAAQRIGDTLNRLTRERRTRLSKNIPNAGAQQQNSSDAKLGHDLKRLVMGTFDDVVADRFVFWIVGMRSSKSRS